MADDDDEILHNRIGGAVAERLARLETKQESIERDTGVIRATLHQINNDLMKLMGSNDRREEIMRQVLMLTKDLPTIAASASAFSDMKEKLNEVLDYRQQKKGSAMAITLIGSMMVGAVTIGSAVTSIILWMSGIFHH